MSRESFTVWPDAVATALWSESVSRNVFAKLFEELLTRTIVAQKYRPAWPILTVIWCLSEEPTQLINCYSVVLPVILLPLEDNAEASFCVVEQLRSESPFATRTFVGL